MANISKWLEEGEGVQHTPAVAVYAGNIINIGSVCGFAPSDIAASALGELAISGVIRVPYIGGIVCNVGDNVWWDANGTPYGGAADGACTCNAAAGDWWVGTLVAPTAATGATADVALNLVNPNLPAWRNKKHHTTAADLTVAAANATYGSGTVVHVTADAGTDTQITFPVGVVGMEWIIQNDEASGGNRCAVDLNGDEIIAGANLTIAATKLALNTKLDSVRGDYIHLICNVAAASWRCVGIRGTWETS